ncbi:uncharacterized protein Z519_01943 [Cladophialophora bantiana CBS 173.52]|uniref:ferric-chelate reductase (NADPH) n=1 Tax=Cladophialophora bantiana (strain ATCC 10958 / CBS 173.52 / CDC B-1940 / NIH 8579) TaxID=1442370 RepID=A0A0D2GDY4_CLAB1|nr:uncharacterized protein Z519_01943 [Cladophialophora bantiana CBS 173.52]KIW96552.1 hypothetical protein Z519_01943 [Cladophialophora bantiana CBS 173.52]
MSFLAIFGGTQHTEGNSQDKSAGPATATITRFRDALNGDVIRLDFIHPKKRWNIGQHLYLCLPETTIWQSHPFTPLSLPRDYGSGSVHSYFVRARMRDMRILADLGHEKCVTIPDIAIIRDGPPSTTPAILTEPNGQSIVNQLPSDANVLCIAGGTRVTFVLPVLLSLLNPSPVPDRKVELI